MNRFGSDKLWLGGAAMTALVVVVIGYFFLIGPQRASTSDVRSKVGDSELQATALQARITTLTAQSRNMSAVRAALATAQQALPAADDVNATPNLLRTLQTLGASTGTSVTSVTVGQPADGTPAPASSGSTVAAPVPATGPALSSIAIGATVTGTMAHLDDFLTRLQTAQPRAVLVTAVTFANQAAAAGTSTGTSTLNLTMSVFTRPAASTPAAATPSTGSTP